VPMLKRVPPYLPFSTFNRFLNDLAEVPLPARIDKSVLTGMSLSTQSQMLSAFRYLGLTNEHGEPTDHLTQLVHTSGNARREVLGEIVKQSYENLFRLGIETTSMHDLLGLIWKEGLRSQDTMRKALNFFCLAARSAGISISPHIRPYEGRRRKLSEARKPGSPSNVVMLTPKTSRLSDESEESQELEDLWRKFPVFNPSWSEKQRKNWLDAFEHLLDRRKGRDASKERSVPA
jgi:hypothetical protein